MHVLRVGGEYLAGRQRSARTALAIAAGVGAVACTTLSLLTHPMAGVLLAASIASVAGKARKQLRRVTKGIRGEALVVERLQSLPDTYFLLNDVVLLGQSGNIEHVVIGPCGVVVIETKNFSGAIAVRDALGRAHPDLKESVLRFVDSIAVFTNPTSRVTVDRARTIVARYSQLLDVILEIARRRKVSGTVAAKLAESLARLTASPTGLARADTRSGRGGMGSPRHETGPAPGAAASRKVTQLARG